MTLLSDLFIRKRRSCAYGETIETVYVGRILAIVVCVIAYRWLT